MRVYLLLDQSGSMAAKWDDTLGAVNSYVQALANDTHVKVVSFDGGYNAGNAFGGYGNTLNYTVLRDGLVNDFLPITNADARPRGSTPLADASARILDEAFEDSPEKAYIIFMTDGGETGSSTPQAVVKEKLARAEDRNWEVVFLGANFDNVVDQAVGLGLNMAKSYNIDAKNLGAEMALMAASTTAYAKVGTRTVFTDADRARAVKK